MQIIGRQMGISLGLRERLVSQQSLHFLFTRGISFHLIRSQRSLYLVISFSSEKLRIYQRPSLVWMWLRHGDPWQMWGMIASMAATCWVIFLALRYKKGTG